MTPTSTEYPNRWGGHPRPAPPVARDSIGRRVVIRAYSADEASAILEAVEESHDSLARWIPDIARRNTLSEVHAGLTHLQLPHVRARRLLFGVWHRTDGRFLGEVGLHDIHLNPDQAAIGYWLRPSARGQGFIHEALDLLHGHASRELRIRQFEAHIACENIVSRRVAERRGYRCVGQRAADPRWDGDTASMLIYVLQPAGSASDT